MSKDSKKRAEYTHIPRADRREIIALMCFEEGGKIKHTVVMERFKCSKETAYEDLRSDEVRSALAELIRREFGVDGALQCYKVLKSALTSESESTRVKVAMYLFDKMISFADEDKTQDGKDIIDKIHEAANGNKKAEGDSKEK